MSKKPAPKQVVRKVRVARREYALWEKAAAVATEGNVSAFMRQSTTAAAKATIEKASAPGAGDAQPEA